MPTRVSDAVVLEGYCLRLTFDDGTVGQVDLRGRVVGRGGVFAALESSEVFRQVVVDKELGTIVWPNGVDFCPDVLYSWVTGRPIPFAEEARPLGHEVDSAGRL